MKSRTKALLLVLCAVMLAVGSVLGTLAYLTDQDAATNTFTVGSVQIWLDETDVKTDGTKDTEARVQGNEYHLIPGHSYIKDPTVTVEGGSEAAYVRMLVTVNFSRELDAIFAPTGADLLRIFRGYDPTIWLPEDIMEDTAGNTRTYEFRYQDIVPKSDADTVLPELFTDLTVPGEITKEELATLVKRDKDGSIIDQFTITVAAHAIQADGFDTADEAWTAFTT